ncbi:hypothetical protein LIER_35473 [Lithospermum erythrorhizon]|uniref:Uncharacterized protein n=1 Tax=Lithospermum erythrorhizon TaxID=34254 RepID=A0AAV3NRU7_LITER
MLRSEEPSIRAYECRNSMKRSTALERRLAIGNYVHLILHRKRPEAPAVFSRHRLDRAALGAGGNGSMGSDSLRSPALAATTSKLKWSLPGAAEILRTHDRLVERGPTNARYRIRPLALTVSPIHR